MVKQIQQEILQKSLQDSIAQQRQALESLLKQPLAEVALACQQAWGDREKLDAALIATFDRVPHCKYLYALDTHARQISDNINHEEVITKDYGRDRTERPYMREVVPSTDFLLSGAYISLRAKRPSLTAIQIVRNKQGQVLGFVGADFDLRDLPLTRALYDEPRYWLQIKGDPSIRGGVFHQTRAESELDKQIDTVIGVLEELMVYHGIFHAILHFSSNRAVIWLHDDPYRYRLLDLTALIDPDTCLAYPRRTYPDNALVPADKIRLVLEGFRQLRLMDEMLYLRSGTLNIFNGIVGLTFSCDGSHYIPFDQFLDKDSEFWDGTLGLE